MFLWFGGKGARRSKRQGETGGFPRGLRGQASVEYLFVLVFIVGFIVSVIVPAVKEAEISLALASSRSAAASFEAEHPEYFVTLMNYSIDRDTVVLRPSVFLRANASKQSPPELTQKMLYALRTVASRSNASCAFATNYNYCLQMG